MEQDILKRDYAQKYNDFQNSKYNDFFKQKFEQYNQSELKNAKEFDLYAELLPFLGITDSMNISDNAKQEILDLTNIVSSEAMNYLSDFMSNYQIIDGDTVIDMSLLNRDDFTAIVKWKIGKFKGRINNSAVLDSEEKGVVLLYSASIYQNISVISSFFFEDLSLKSTKGWFSKIKKAFKNAFSSVISSIVTVATTAALTVFGAMTGAFLGGPVGAIAGGIAGFAIGVDLSSRLSCQFGFSDTRHCLDCKALYPNMGNYPC